jgi:HEAT repeats
MAAAAVLLSLLFMSSTASAARIDDLVKQLASDDFRVRTQAALALGATSDNAAVRPLCGATGDSNQTVKLAVIAALGKLGKDDGTACLRAARKKESDGTVTAAIDKAIEKSFLGGDPPSPGASAKWYVAVQVTNKTSRPNLEIEALVRKAMQEKLLANSNCALAPRSETNQQATDLVKNRKLKGYLLIASVEPFNYSGGNLTVQLKVTMWTYPDRALKAEFGPKLTQQGTSKTDTEGESLLIKMASQTSVENLTKVAASL